MPLNWAAAAWQARRQPPHRQDVCATHLLVQTVRDQTAGALEELSIFLAEGVQLFALGIEHSKDAPMLVRHRNNDFGARCVERGQIAWIVVDVTDDDRFPDSSAAPHSPCVIGKRGYAGGSLLCRRESQIHF